VKKEDKPMTNDEARAYPPALFVEPLFRYRLTDPSATSLGYRWGSIAAAEVRS
jgi:hypothetical protein